jgi:hypothetical protein
MPLDDHVQSSYQERRFSSMVGNSPGAVYRASPVGLTPSDFEQLRGNAWYRARKLHADAHANEHWQRPASEKSLPDYHPIPLDEFLQEMEAQQRKDVEFLYELQHQETAEYFSKRK